MDGFVCVESARGYPKLMFSRLAKLFHEAPPHERLKRLARAYDPRGGEEDTLQGALADAVLCLRDEGNRNGWLNGGGFYEECIDLIKKNIFAINPPDARSLSRNVSPPTSRPFEMPLLRSFQGTVCLCGA